MCVLSIYLLIVNPYLLQCIYKFDFQVFFKEWKFTIEILKKVDYLQFYYVLKIAMKSMRKLHFYILILSTRSFLTNLLLKSCKKLPSLWTFVKYIHNFPHLFLENNCFLISKGQTNLLRSFKFTALTCLVTA